jgi:hypothetical protein
MVVSGRASPSHRARRSRARQVSASHKALVTPVGFPSMGFMTFMVKALGKRLQSPAPTAI